MSQDIAAGAMSISEPASNTRIYRLHSQAMTRLAHGTCVVIATLLAIPDGVALIPRSTDLVSWALSVIGVWLSAAVLWFIGFLGILHCVAFLVRGIEVSDDGIRVWRLARPISWEHIDAVAMEPQYLFSKVFSLTPIARKLTIFEHKKSWRKGAEPSLVPHHLPSFLFAPSDFDSLLADITKHKFNIVPAASNVVVAEQKNFHRLKSVYGMLGWQRIGLSILIAFGLVTFLGRKAVTNYQYNSGNKAFEAHNIPLAHEYYENAALLDPTFAAAWNNLANVEFIEGDFAKAQKHWVRAIFYKPDFVEPKVSLVYFALQDRQFSAANDYLNSALGLAPSNSAALVTRADYALRLGHTRDAISDARGVLAADSKHQSVSKFMAACVLARGKLQQGHLEEAQSILNETASVKDPTARNGLNITYRLLIASEIDRALGKLDDAQQSIDAAVRRAPRSAEVMLEKANVAIARKDFSTAASSIANARKLLPKNPWNNIAQSHLMQAQGKSIDASILQDALNMPNQDARSLAEIASLYLAFGDPETARLCAKKSTNIESNTPLALSVLRETSPPPPPPIGVRSADTLVGT